MSLGKNALSIPEVSEEKLERFNHDFLLVSISLQESRVPYSISPAHMLCCSSSTYILV